MSKRTMGALCAVALACTGAAAFAASGFGDDPATGTYGYVKPALEATSGPTGTTSRELALERRGKRRRPVVTNLITTQPVAVEPDSERVAILTCTKKQGIPLTGGAISPPAPAEVAISVISRYNPNDLAHLKPRTYYVGVRNLSKSAAASFNATLVCAKGIDQ